MTTGNHIAGAAAQANRKPFGVEPTQENVDAALLTIAMGPLFHSEDARRIGELLVNLARLVREEK